MNESWRGKKVSFSASPELFVFILFSRSELERAEIVIFFCGHKIRWGSLIRSDSEHRGLSVRLYFGEVAVVGGQQSPRSPREVNT